MRYPTITPEMQALWNRAMHLHRTSTSYGVALPQPGTSYPPPAEGSFVSLILFAATASPEAYVAFEEAVYEDMVQGKARGRASGSGKRAIPLTSSLNIQVEFTL